MAEYAAERIVDDPNLELVRTPELSVVMFRRIGWSAADYERWSEQLLADGIGFVLPSKWKGETILRFAVLHPSTSESMIDEILATLR